MSYRPARITQADVARAIRAAQQCGGQVRIMRDGTIAIDHEATAEPQAPASKEHPGYVYFVAGGPFIKIGWSLLMKGRIANLQTANPYKLQLLAQMPGTIDTEREMHERFVDHRVEGEWFRDCQEIREFIKDLAA